MPTMVAISGASNRCDDSGIGSPIIFYLPRVLDPYVPTSHLLEMCAIFLEVSTASRECKQEQWTAPSLEVERPRAKVRACSIGQDS